MSTFYSNLLGATVNNYRGTQLEIVAVWQNGEGVRVLGVALNSKPNVLDGGEQFLVDLPDTGWVVVPRKG